MKSELIGYVVRYGGFCRDCADNDGICPLSGMPCDPKPQRAVIKHTIEALKYGIEHGFIESPFATKVPDVPELERYNANNGLTNYEGMQKSTNGEYVRHDQAVEVIAALKSELYDMSRDRDQALEWRDHDKQRAEAAEAKIAQSEKPIGYVSKSFFESLKIDRFHSIAAYVLRENSERYSEPLYTAPVASDSHLRAENERLRAAAKPFA